MPRPPTPRRIVIVVPKLTVGGTERHLVAVLPKLDRARFRIEVMTTRGAGPLDQALRDQDIPVMPAPAAFSGQANALVALPWLWWHLMRQRPDLVHFLLPEAYLVGGLAALLAARRCCVMSRRSLNVYQDNRPISRRLEHLMHRAMTALVGNSQAAVDQLASEGAPQERLALIHNGIDTAAFARGDRAAARSALGLTPDGLVLLIVATLLPYKGHADLLQALAGIAGQLPARWDLLVAGRDEGMGAGLNAQAEAAGLTGHVHWLGERGDVAALLAASDIAILASHEESFPNAALEAMAAGLPVVATRVGGCAEAIEEGVTGSLVPPHAPVALGQAILALARDREVRAAMGRAGRRRVVERFSLEACVADYEGLYEAVLAGRPLAATRDAPPIVADRQRT
ncbi:MAG: glycosyltransferase [Kiloniellales bacterium]